MHVAPRPLVLASSLGIVIFHSEALRTFVRFQQTRKAKREAGGQLFAALAPGRIDVLLATGPTSSAERGRYFFHPNRKEEQREITAAFRKQLHFVGDWHTHPEREPTPSGPDIAKAREIFDRSKHELNGILLVVVGTQKLPKGLWVAWITQQGVSPAWADGTLSTKSL